MNRFIILAALGGAVATARPVLAQSAMKDVPAQHWARSAVQELQSRGIMTGYPNGTFGGQRAITRYEFALAGQRMLQDVQRRIDAAVAARHLGNASPLATRQEVDARIRNLQQNVSQLRVDVDELHRTMSQLQTRAASLRAEVDEIRQQLGTMSTRVGGIRAPAPLGGEHRP